MGIAVKFNEPLKNYTTMRIGGAVREMYFPETAGQAVQVYEMLLGRGIVPVVLGNGSNIVADDADLNICVINTTKMKNMTLTDTVITADGGALLSEPAVLAQQNGLTGLEFAHGIPGTLGGAVLMNAGAYGGEMKDVVMTTTAYNKDRGEYTVFGNEHQFAYRESIFSKNGDLILSCAIGLKKGSKAAIAEKMEELKTRRRSSQPLDKPSAGSTFKRPDDGYAAQLIERAGLKGYKIGGAQVSAKHAGFIINSGNATFYDVMMLIEYIQDTVEKRTGIRLEPEVKFIRAR